MQGARANIGRTTVPMSGKRATKLGPAAGRVFGGEGQGQSAILPPPVPAPRVVRPVAATPNVPRSGSREVANVSGAGLVAAGQQTTGGQPVQQPQPPSSRPVVPAVYPGQMR
jgi:hypothetical protein